MDKLLGHLAQYASFSTQGELLCTQGLAYLLRDSEAERAFTELLGSAVRHPISPGLRWHAELRQADGGRPDLEGRNEEGHTVVKIEAKLGAAFGHGQLDSYINDLCGRKRVGTLLILVPASRMDEITGQTREHFKLSGDAPWRISREELELPCSVITWESLLETLSTVESDRFRDDLAQFHAMYRVFNGDDMEPLTSDEEVLAWRDRVKWWEALVDQVTRALNPPADRVLPMQTEGKDQPYRMRYLRPDVAEMDSYCSIGTRDPFQHHRTPIWLRFHKATGRYSEIARRLERSVYGNVAVRSQGHLWLPLEVPFNSSRDAMISSLIAQVQQILAVAYGSRGAVPQSSEAGDS